MKTTADTTRKRIDRDRIDRAVRIPRDTEEVIMALQKVSSSPYAHYTHSLGQDAVQRHGTATLIDLATDADTCVTTVRTGCNHGFAAWRRALWESRHLGMPSARLDAFLSSDPQDDVCLTSLVKRLRVHWRRQGIAYIFTRLNTADLAGVRTLEHHGFVTIDNLLTFSMPLNVLRRDAGDCDVELTEAAPEDVPELRRIASESFLFDRFHNDPLIAQTTADTMHAEWIENQVCNGLADHVVVARDGGQPLGFLTCKIDQSSKQTLGLSVGTIVLVAVDGCARGRGIGCALSAAALNWFQSQGVELVEVSTQSINVPASRTYLRAGFRYVRSSTTLRLHLTTNGGHHA